MGWRKFGSGMLLALLVSSSAWAQGVLFISELCDPRLNYLDDRFIEIYNAGDSAVELENWSLIAIGNSSDIFTWELSGTIQPGEALVAGDATTVDPFQVDFPEENWSTSNSTWNGKVGDGARLLNADDEVVDFIMVPETTFENMDMVRNPDILFPNTDYTPSEWTSAQVDLPSEASPGTHVVNGQVQNPSIETIEISPTGPFAGQDVSVTAEVTDSEGTLTSVLLHWGVAEDAMENEIAMVSDGGSSYTTSVPIPGQNGGVMVYFTITASNNLEQSTTTALQSYWLPQEMEIPAIQGTVDESPFVGIEVITSGVVTGAFPGHVAIRDGEGEWRGLWLRTEIVVSVGDSLVVRGTPNENGTSGFQGTTLLDQLWIVEHTETPHDLIPFSSTTDQFNTEGFEGVLVEVDEAVCSAVDLGDGTRWEIEDEQGTILVGSRGLTFDPVLGSAYSVAGVIVDENGVFVLEPRDQDDITFLGDTQSPFIVRVDVQNESQLVVIFSEDVSGESAAIASNFEIDDASALSSARIENHPERVMLTVEPMSEGEHQLVVSGVEDLFGNAIVDETLNFDFLISTEPEGYYDDAAGLVGQELRAALHDIIDDHTEITYSEVWTAFYTTDVKPNGMVWDMFSDIPGEVPPYEYELGTDQGGDGSTEGTGYTREHSWPRSWFGGEIAPMNTDINMIYPCDARVNGHRGNYPYGEVDVPEWTSLNGSKRGPCVVDGYSGTVFEPIDAYKGDLARTYFYMTTRYYGEDSAWPGSPMTDGADLMPWAEEMLLQWNDQDPVSQKEVARNNAIYAIQDNRNPFIDHPEFVDDLFNPTGVEDQVALAGEWKLDRIYPNPFNPSTTVSITLPAQSQLRVSVFNIMGQQVALLADGAYNAGQHHILFDANGMANGIYFVRATVPGKMDEVKKVLLVK